MCCNVSYKNCALASVIVRRTIRRSKEARTFELRQVLALFLYFVVRRLFFWSAANKPQILPYKALILVIRNQLKVSLFTSLNIQIYQKKRHLRLSDVSNP